MPAAGAPLIVMMTLFRQDRANAQLDHLTVLSSATTADDIELVSWAFMHPKPVLVGLGDVPTIVKIQEAGDDGLTFRALFDDAITLREFNRMKAHKVDEREAIGDVLWRIELVTELRQHPRATFHLKSKNENE